MCNSIYFQMFIIGFYAIELRPLRQKHQESLPEYEAKKRDYDSQVQMIEKTISNVIQVYFKLFMLKYKFLIR